MNHLNSIYLNEVFNRNAIADEIKTILLSFDSNYKNVNFKKGIYIYGSPGSGKTEFVMSILKELDYDIINYDAGDIRNKSFIETIADTNISNHNVLQMMSGKMKKIAIVMDEIDGMNNGDKGGITALIKLIRQKKTKKQRLENKTVNPIICISNYYIDKKIKELMKVCNTFELKTPTCNQIENIVTKTFYGNGTFQVPKHLLVDFIQGDMRKFKFIYDIYNKRPDILTDDFISNIFHTKSYNEDSKKITHSLINRHTNIDQHLKYMNETDRTIVALLWHENIVDMMADKPIHRSFPFYSKIIDTICYSDYIDRITFQQQIWQFNEMSSLMKTFYNNKTYHDTFPENQNRFQPETVRFTKVLTKYSTEYNNLIFIYNLSQKLNMDKKDLLAYFQELRLYDTYIRKKCDKSNIRPSIIDTVFEDYDITKLIIKRMYRYLDKNIKKDVIDEEYLSDIDD